MEGLPFVVRQNPEFAVQGQAVLLVGGPRVDQLVLGSQELVLRLNQIVGLNGPLRVPRRGRARRRRDDLLERLVFLSDQ
jgi:hypothetical protein